jgi:hypothetical protein
MRISSRQGIPVVVLQGQVRSVGSIAFLSLPVNCPIPSLGHLSPMSLMSPMSPLGHLTPMSLLGHLSPMSPLGHL